MTSIIEHLMKTLIWQCVERPSLIYFRCRENTYASILSRTVDHHICGDRRLAALDPFIEAMKVFIRQIA